MFDVGNVLVELHSNGIQALAAALRTTVQDLMKFVNGSGLQACAYIGAVTPETYLSEVNRRFQSDLTRAQVVSLLARDIDRPIDGIEDLLEKIHRTHKLAAFSDTFFGHWESFLSTPMAKRFDRLVASYEIGLTKSDPKAFSLALGVLGAGAGEVLFLDDLELNVQNARQCGMDAFRAGSVGETRTILADAGILGRRGA
jgi:putative hydrolase of the HAD superfamily